MLREKLLFEFNFHTELGVMQVDVVGAWTVEEARRYGREAGQHFQHARKQSGRLRLLLNLMQNQLMTQDVIVSLTRSGTKNGQPDDIIAIAVGSPELDLQLRRMFGERNATMFDSVENALDWLRDQGRE
jgi:hypothetical protein